MIFGFYGPDRGLDRLGALAGVLAVVGFFAVLIGVPYLIWWLCTHVTIAW